MDVQHMQVAVAGRPGESYVDLPSTIQWLPRIRGSPFRSQACCGCSSSAMLTGLEYMQAAVSGRPGAAYVDLPSNILMGPMDQGQTPSTLQIPPLGPNRLLRERPHADGTAVADAAQLLASAKRCSALHFKFSGSCIPCC